MFCCWHNLRYIGLSRISGNFQNFIIIKLFTICSRSYDFYIYTQKCVWLLFIMVFYKQFHFFSYRWLCCTTSKVSISYVIKADAFIAQNFSKMNRFYFKDFKFKHFLKLKKLHTKGIWTKYLIHNCCFYPYLYKLSCCTKRMNGQVPFLLSCRTMQVAKTGSNGLTTDDHCK